MEGSGTILCQISSLKDMLDQVNEEIESDIQVTREIESEIVRCTEIEADLSSRESELTKTLYLAHFEIDGLLSVTANSRNSLKLLEEELHRLALKREELQERIDKKREQFSVSCLEFQRIIDKGENDELVKMLSEKEHLVNEIHILDQKNHALKNSMMAFVEEVLQDLHDANSALQVEIQRANHENEKLLKDIHDLKAMLS